jgi:hypothetical protein
MELAHSDDPMCPGTIANYTCSAGGINAFKVSLTGLQLAYTCNGYQMLAPHLI